MEQKLSNWAFSKKISYFLIIMFFQMMVFSFFVMPSWAAKLASLENVSGNVRVFTQGKKRGRKGISGASLLSKHIVKTLGDDASADIVFASGSRVRIMPNSELVLSKIEGGEKETDVNMKLAVGKIFNVVNKLSKNSRYSVSTHTAIAGVKGTVFSVEAVSEKHAVLMVKEGSVDAANSNHPDKTVAVSDLHKTSVKGEDAPGEPVKMTPEEIAMFDLLEDIYEAINEEIQEEVQDAVMQQLREEGTEFEFEN